ncbi:potassium transporter [Oceanicola sp. 22II-s10i]|uniref:cation:proton antiporter domain-containing protein n=1 Tax=Oceanicola sp. 22II-s10i TaxID=1317116 RepID=UPI000B528A08|nr:cation:proton antiporter [Oceanicola sp. 22II-s10i]OWU83738.1 potassium transporter [Oceanicola sp. 22II-s10i]
MIETLLLAFIFLCAGIISVPIAARLGLGSVLGYLIAGILIGPILAGFQVDVVAIQHFAEFGVVMMLFLVGLELAPRHLWQMRRRLMGLGGLQLGLTTLAVAGAMILLGFDWRLAVAAGLVLTMSSTAIVLQTLNEKGLNSTEGGRGSFSVLLFQDIAVIPILALLPLLAISGAVPVDTHATDAAHGAAEAGHGASLSLVEGLPGWQVALVTAGALAVVVAAGLYLVRPMFRFVAMAGLRELFLATALCFVVAVALIMSLVGLSPALGTFLAGMMLANSEYRHELESDIDPFRGLLLGLFFITVGAAMDFGLLLDNLAPILGATLGLMALKAAILFGIAIVMKIRGVDRWLFALGLAQAGEFGFVLLSFAVSSHIFAPDLADRLSLVVALSMLLTPGLFVLFDRVIAPRFATGDQREPDLIEEHNDVLIAGHGRWGGIVNRMLTDAGYRTTVLDHSSAQLDMLRDFGFRVFYGDATRPDLLKAAGIEKAKLFVVAIDDKEKITELVRYVCRTYPHVHVLARAIDRTHVYDLYFAGCRDIIRETFDSGVRAGRSAFEALGIDRARAEALAGKFVDDDKRALLELAPLWDPTIPLRQNTAYMNRARQIVTERERGLAESETKKAG